MHASSPPPGPLTASLFVEFLTRECTRQCNARSTRKVTECLRAAKSEDDIKRCYE